MRKPGFSRELSAAINTLAGQLSLSQSAFNLENCAEFYDDFPYRGAIPVAPHGTLGWDLTGATGLSATGYLGRPGTLRFSCTSVANLFLGAHAVDQAPAIYWFSVQTHGTISSNWRARVGLAGTTSSEPPNGIYFKNAGANWIAVTRSGSTSTETDSGIGQANAFKQFKILVHSTSLVEFYIDGVLVAIHTTNIPSATFTEISVVVMSGDGGTRTIEIDYFQARYINLTR